LDLDANRFTRFKFGIWILVFEPTSAAMNGTVAKTGISALAIMTKTIAVIPHPSHSPSLLPRASTVIAGWEYDAPAMETCVPRSIAKGRPASMASTASFDSFSPWPVIRGTA
jgi:hypothetical protein